MRLSIATLTFALLLQTAAHAQTPDQVLAAAGAQQVQQTFGKGVQIYNCQLQNGAPAWIFAAPEATLYQLTSADKNGPVQVALHSAGPVWQWNDGSGVYGTLLQSVPSPDPNSIPELLLSTQHFGTKGGVLSTVTYVLRSQTNGGTTLAAGCDTAHIGTVARVPYTATYTFYAGGPAVTAK